MMRYLDHLKMDSSSMQLAQQVVFGSVVLVSANLLVTQGVTGLAKQVRQYNNTTTIPSTATPRAPILALLLLQPLVPPSARDAAPDAAPAAHCHCCH